MSDPEPIWLEPPRHHATEVAARAYARDHYDPVAHCEKCGGIGVFFRERTEEFTSGWYETVPCECFFKASQRAALQQAGIPEVYLSASLDTWTNTGRGKREIAENESSLKLARSIIDKIDEAAHDGLHVWISGTEGTGKTWIACSILAAARLRGYPARFFSAMRLVRHSIEHREDFESLYDVDWLLLDGIDSLPPTKSGYEVGLVHDLIRERVQQQMPTIFTASMALAKCGEAFVSDIRSLLEPVTLQLQFVGKPFQSGQSSFLSKWVS